MARKLATVAGYNAILLFVAELNGYRSGTVEDKTAFGHKCWLDGAQPHEVHERIWANRLYTELYGFTIAQMGGEDFYWSVPIELDASASMLQYIGILLGDKACLEATNVLSNGTLNDPWNLVTNVNRKLTKPVIMRQLYGSSKSAVAILNDFEMEYTAQEIEDLEEGLHTGAYGVANALKSFIIGNANLAPTIYPVVWGEQLEVPCNRHYREGDHPVVYSSITSSGTDAKLIHWKTIEVPNLKSFKRWTMTGLIHSLDSRVIDLVMQKLDWGIDIHDAVIINPEDAMTVRTAYAEALEAVYTDRESILNNYFASIGIKSTEKTQREWAKLKSMITPLDAPFKASIWAVK